MTKVVGILDLSAAPTRPLTSAGDIIVANASGVPTRDVLSRKNLLINGDMSVYQRVATTVAVASVDMTYQTTDRWKTVRDTVGVSWNLYAYPLGPVGNNPRADLWQSNGNSTKGGKLQILTARDTNGLVGQLVSLQAKIIQAGSFSDIRMAILSWSGTADAPTDPISAWNASGTNPTLAANWAYVNTPTNLGVTTGWLTYKLEGFTVPANCQNLAVLIWSNNTTNTSGQNWYFSDVQLELGSVCTSFERINYFENLVRCLPFFQKTYEVGVAPGTATIVGEVLAHAGNTLAGSTAGNVIPYCSSGTRFGVPMRATPTVTIYSPTTGVAGDCRIGGVSNKTGCTAGGPSMTSFLEYLAFSNVSAVAIGDRNQLQFHATASAEI